MWIRLTTDWNRKNQWRCQHCRYVMSAVEKVTWYHTNFGTIPAETLAVRLVPYHKSRRAHLFPDYRTITDKILQKSTATRFRWVLFTQYSVDRQSIFDAWRCIQRPNVHKSHIWTRDNPRAIHEHESWVSIRLRRQSLDWGGWRLLPEMLTTQRHDCLEAVLPRLLAVVFRGVRQRLYCQQDGARSTMGKSSREMDVKGRLHDFQGCGI
jgi:hypothetical protein